MRFWLGVVQRAHVRRGVELGIAQIGHGKEAGVRRMQPGDGLVYYSPRMSFPDGAPLRAFTAIGRIADGDPWQAEEAGFRPWRRAVEYDESARETPIAPLLDVLELTRGNRNWGLVMRRGHLPLSSDDFSLIAREMGALSAATLAG